MSAVLNPGAMPALPPEVPARSVRRSGGDRTVSEWKRQVRWFAATVILLGVAVAGGSGASMWHLLSTMAAAERIAQERNDTAVEARLAVLQIDRELSRTVAQDDPGTVRAAAVGSIAAAARLEDAVTALQQAWPDSADTREMARVVEAVKAPRVNVIVLARSGERTRALAALEQISDQLKHIDALSTAVLGAQKAERARAAADRQALFTRLLSGLLAAVAGGLVVGWFVYRRLMQRLARTDAIERLLDEVQQSATELDARGLELDELNADVQRGNRSIGLLLGRFGDAAQAITQEAEAGLAEVQSLAASCDTSAASSRQHAGDAEAVAGRIQETSAQMQELTKSAEALQGSCVAIQQFAEQIGSISATTRLLSLNAAVEAARAGAAGRGFGVIAAAVRQLSEDTQSAARQIRQASQTVAAHLTATSAAAHKTGELMEDCAGRVTRLDASARASLGVAEDMSRGIQGFRGSFQRQVQRIDALEGEVRSIGVAMQDGQRHAQLLDTTSAAMARTSGTLLARLRSLGA